MSEINNGGDDSIESLNVFSVQTFDKSPGLVASLIGLEMVQGLGINEFP